MSSAKPEKDALCWIWHDGRPMKCRVFHLTAKHYCAANTDAFVTSRGEFIGVGECVTLPPGYKNETFAPWVEGEPAPEFVRCKAGYFIPKSTPPKPTPLF